MTRIISLFLVGTVCTIGILFYLLGLQKDPNHFKGEGIAFKNVNVLPMTSDSVLINYTVVIKGDRIITIAKADDITFDDDFSVIDAAGKYLLPGIGEMHGHIPPLVPPDNTPRYMTPEYLEHTLFLYTAAGVTTVRNTLNWPNHLNLKALIKSGDIFGPNLYLAGPGLSGSSVISERGAIDMVKKQYAEGWDFLKIRTGLTLAEYDAISKTAKELGISFVGHVPTDVGLIHAIESGQRTIDHLEGYISYLSAFKKEDRAEKLHEVIELTKENNVWIVPTLALWENLLGVISIDTLKSYEELQYIPQDLLLRYIAWEEKNMALKTQDNLIEDRVQADARIMLLSEMNKAGVNILLGTNAPQLFSVPGFSIHREFALMEQAGMTPYEIIKTGTTNVGQFFIDEDKFGTITLGARADLILVDENPFIDLNNLKLLQGVMVSGQWMSHELISHNLNVIKDIYNDKTDPIN